MTCIVLTAIALAVGAGCNNTGAPLAPTPTADFSGNYSGTFRVNNCTADGIWVGACDAEGFTSGSTVPMQLALGQNQTTVTGSISLGGLTGTFQGTVTGDILNGTAAIADVTDSGLTIKTSVSGWHSTISNGALSGGFTVVFKEASSFGSLTVTAVIDQLKH